MTSSWKDNWEETKQNFVDWWNHQGLLLYIWDLPERMEPHEEVDHPGEWPGVDRLYTDPEWRAKWIHHQLAYRNYPADTFPVADTNLGPGSLALHLGGEARLSEDTVWFEPCISPDDPEGHPPLRFDPDSRWWRITEETVRACQRLSEGRYVVGCPDLVENIDIVAALRAPVGGQVRGGVPGPGGEH
jgi:hypothetical protein